MMKTLLKACRTGRLFLVCMLVATSVYGQVAEARFTFAVQNASLEEFIKRIEGSSEYAFVYSEEVRLSHQITLDIRQQTLAEVLKQAFDRQPVGYRIKGKHILLYKEVKSKPVSRRYTISGYVTDGTSSETLIGANIVESRQQKGTTTNPYGFYSITLPEGETELKFSYLGYGEQSLQLSLGKDTLLNIRMEDNNQLQEVIVVADKSEAGLSATQMGANEIPAAQIRHTPTILGEADVMKTIQLMPGVQAGIDGSAGLYVRGGGADQNLILLDGVPVYNVDHLFGFFSVFTPEAVKKVTLFKSSFPARFGGRLSSVVDVRTNDGDMRKYHGSFSIGLLTSKFNLEGPIVKDRTSFNISARRSYFDLLTKPFMPKGEKFGYYFYDVNGKINHRFSDRSRLFLSVYNGSDHFSSTLEEHNEKEVYKSDGRMNWGNTIVSARWNYIFNNRLFSNTTVAFNKYQYNVASTTADRYTKEKEEFQNEYSSDYRSGIRDWSYQIDFDYIPLPTHHIKFGAQYLYHSFRPEVMTSRIHSRIDQTVEEDTLYNNRMNKSVYAHEASAYVEDNVKIGDRLRLNAGVHLSLFQVQEKSYFSLQPRLSARYQWSDAVAFKASYTQMSQYVHLLTTSQMALPTDLWVPVTRNIKPMKSDQYSLGSYYNGIAGWEFSVEGYYKSMRNVLEYKDGVSFIGSSSGWEEKVEMGRGRSFGVELMAQKSVGNSTGWVAYTLAKSDRQFAKGGINNGERFPYKYDRRHAVNVTFNHRFSERIDIGASWVFYTGGTVTIPEEITVGLYPSGDNDGYYNPYNPSTSIPGSKPAPFEVPYVEHRNNYRLPASHRLNIGVNFHKKTKHGVRTWNVSLYNAYNAMNPTFVYEDAELGRNNEFKRTIKKYTLLPLIPSFTYTYKF